MAHLTFDAPLRWPSTRPATPAPRQRADHGFSANMSLDESIKFLQDEIVQLNPRAASLSTDIENITNLRARRPIGARTGACLEIKLHNDRYTLACDRWQKLEHNIYALHLALRQLKNIERWGLADLETLLCAFAPNAGQAAAAHIPSVSAGDEPSIPGWMRTLGLGPTATLDDATAVYHRRARASSGNDSKLIALNAAMAEAKKHLE